jgi:hypothetical protein
LLNDFGCAVVAGKQTNFIGALRHAPDRILEAKMNEQQYIPQFSDDYEMFVRCLYQRLHPHEFEAIQGQEDASVIKTSGRYLAPITLSEGNALLFMRAVLCTHHFCQPRMSYGIWKCLSECAQQAGEYRFPAEQKAALVQMRALISQILPSAELTLAFDSAARRLEFLDDATAAKPSSSIQTSKFAGIERLPGCLHSIYSCLSCALLLY